MLGTRRLIRQMRQWGSTALGWRAFLTNAVILFVTGAALALTPATVSHPIAQSEAGVLVIGLSFSLIANLLVLHRTFQPLVRLRATMASIDPLAPGVRVDPGRADRDVRSLTDAFNAMLERLEAERRDSASRALRAGTLERRRIARELHDELGQRITGALLLLNQAGRTEGGDPAALGAAREMIRGCLDETRRIAADLRPVALDDLGLISALDALGREIEEHSGLIVERRLPARDDWAALPVEQEHVLYRVAQEALTNAVRHSGAGSVELELERRRDVVRLAVADDGTGIAGDGGEGGGLLGMRERALLVGGELTIDSVAQGGTRVRLQLVAGKEGDA